MMYSYLTLGDETEIVHSQVIERDGQPTVVVNFERPTEAGFDTARCELPSYEWISNAGYSEEEIVFFTEFLQNNAHLIYRYAQAGGVKIA
jgi:hypothetical protein